MRYLFLYIFVFCSLFLYGSKISIDSSVIKAQISAYDKQIVQINKQKEILNNLLTQNTKEYYLDKQKASWDNNSTGFNGLVRTVYEDNTTKVSETLVLNGSFRIQVEPNKAFHLVFRTTTSKGEMTHKNALRLSVSPTTGVQKWKMQNPTTKRWRTIDIYDNSLKADMIPFSKMRWL